MQTALVFQGGGALGAYELGAIQALYAAEPDLRPAVVSGVSIGAINAAVLVGAKGKPVETLTALWERLVIQCPPLFPRDAARYLSLWGNSSFFQPRFDLLNAPYWTSYYDTAPLRRLLREFVDFEKLNSSPTQFLITALDVKEGSLEVFDNRQTKITAEHVLASASLPPGFPMTRIDGKQYWDGGLFSNTPLAPVIERLKVADGESKRIVVMNLFPCKGSVPTTMPEVLDRMFEVIFSNKLRFDIETLQKVNQFVEVVSAIDRALPTGDPIRKLPGFVRLKQYTLIPDVLIVENQSPDLVCAPFDFSQASIHARVEAGRRDMAAALEARKPAKAPAASPRKRRVATAPVKKNGKMGSQTTTKRRKAAAKPR